MMLDHNDSYDLNDYDDDDGQTNEKGIAWLANLDEEAVSWCPLWRKQRRRK